MKFSVFTASTPVWTPAEVASTLSAQGWDGVEWGILDVAPVADGETPSFWSGNLAHWPSTGIEQQVDLIRQTTSSANLEISAMSCYVEAAEENIEEIDRLLAATAAVGGRRLRVFPPKLDPTIGYPAAMEAGRRAVSQIAERAQKRGVQALLETHQHSLISSASAALRLLDGVDSAHVGLIHDIGNAVIEGREDYLATFQMLGDYLAHVHVKNSVWAAGGARDEDGALIYENRWAPLREGQASVREYFEALREVGYDDWVTVEDFSTEVPLEQRTQENLEYVRAVAHRVYGR